MTQSVLSGNENQILLAAVFGAERAEIPLAFSKFCALPDADVPMKQRYQPLCCEKWRRG
jgi:hypothetical protein